MGCMSRAVQRDWTSFANAQVSVFPPFNNCLLPVSLLQIWELTHSKDSLDSILRGERAIVKSREGWIQSIRRSLHKNPSDQKHFLILQGKTSEPTSKGMGWVMAKYSIYKGLILKWACGGVWMKPQKVNKHGRAQLRSGYEVLKPKPKKYPNPFLQELGFCQKEKRSYISLILNSFLVPLNFSILSSLGFLFHSDAAGNQ